MIVRDGITFVRTARRVRAELGQRHRYAHVLRVTRLAVQIARAHRMDTARALTAGLLHDLARLYSGAQLIEASQARHLAIDAFERANPIVLHARLGAELARERYDVDDPAVLSAMRKHTVGGAEMSPLDCAVYLADGLEPGRDFAERAALAQLALRDLDRAMLAVLRSSAAHLRENGLTVAPQTLAALSVFEARMRAVA
ncbi:MAG TPA: bis(5'-nucleosyl)-tetraphosphatase (symmetrical) YqeK [Candidatus Binatia bacterium]|nr:bis(5'-nucleosyl)-tetraphosphatase (symmetrical) YqeK [Candidatus Binatia bacterium]